MTEIFGKSSIIIVKVNSTGIIEGSMRYPSMTDTICLGRGSKP